MEIFEQGDLIDFLNLTSDTSLRSAAWPLDDWTSAGGTLLAYGEVTSQDNPPEIKIQKNLLASLLISDESKIKTEVFVQDIKQRKAYIDALMIKVKSHKVYLWLKSHDHFKSAEQRFNRLRRNAKSGKILSEFAEIRFYRIVALGIGARLLAEKNGFKRKYASSKQLVQARGHAIKLKNLLAQGVRLSDWQSQKKLNELLEQLSLEVQLADRKPKNSENFDNRQCLEGIAMEMLMTFDNAFPACLMDLAGMIGWLIDSSTVERLVKRVKTNHQLALAKALKAYPPNSA